MYNINTGDTKHWPPELPNPFIYWEDPQCAQHRVEEYLYDHYYGTISQIENGLTKQHYGPVPDRDQVKQALAEMLIEGTAFERDAVYFHVSQEEE